MLLKTVRESAKGPEMIVSRADKDLVKRLFEMEVPEIYNGAVEIVGIAREPGSRSKVAVHAKQDGVDAVGSCVGLRGIRIQNIVNELHGEKIDVVQWSKDPGTYISNSLSPSSVMRVELDPATGGAVAVVPDRQLSLAIGKEGQNARLAARLTGWNVDIRSNVEVEAEAVARAAEEAAPRTAAEVEQAAQKDVAAEEPAEAVAEAVAEPIAAEQAEAEAKRRSPLPPSRRPIAAEQAEAEVEEAAIEPIAAEQAVAPVEEAATEIEAELEAPVPEGVLEDAVQVEEATEEEPAEGVLVEEPAPIDLPAILIPELDELVPEEAPAVESTSIQDLPEDVWSLRRNTPAEPGVIRFAEDIDELSRFGPRRGRGGGRKGRGGRRTKARRR